MYDLILIVLQNSRENNVIIKSDSFDIEIVKKPEFWVDLNQPGFNGNNSNNNENNTNNYDIDNDFVNDNLILFCFKSKNGLFCYWLVYHMMFFLVLFILLLL